MQTGQTLFTEGFRVLLLTGCVLKELSTHSSTKRLNTKHRQKQRSDSPCSFLPACRVSWRNRTGPRTLILESPVMKFISVSWRVLRVANSEKNQPKIQSSTFAKAEDDSARDLKIVECFAAGHDATGDTGDIAE